MFVNIACVAVVFIIIIVGFLKNFMLMLYCNGEKEKNTVKTALSNILKQERVYVSQNGNIFVLSATYSTV